MIYRVYLYAYGTGVERDDTQALAWYRKAADQGHTSASYNLATLYAAGEGVPRDDAKALERFRQAPWATSAASTWTAGS